MDTASPNPEVEYYSHVKPKEVDWLWYPYIPYGKITLLQGDPGDGKSTFMLNIAASVSTGGSFPDGTKAKITHPVIYQCSEDGVADTIKPRLVKAGADCERISFIPENDAALTIDDERIERALKKTGSRLLVLDPIQAYIPPEMDMLNAVKMRSTMKKLANIAEKYSCAVVLIGHMTKSSGGKKLYRGLGSIDIAAVARSVLMIVRDEDDHDIRYMIPVKSSLAYEGRAVKFLMDRELGFLPIGACNLLETDADIPKENKLEKAERLLQKLLSDADMMASTSIIEEFVKMGISERTVRSAAKKLGVESIRKGGAWYWRLPKGRVK